MITNYYTTFKNSKAMGIILNLNSISVLSLSSKFNTIDQCHRTTTTLLQTSNKRLLSFSKGKIIRAAASSTTNIETDAETSDDEPPSIDFAFVSSVLLPDGTPDIHTRSACGGQKLRDIMLDSNIELYGPYARVLLNCAGGGVCGTCMVEVVQGKELLSLRTDKEKEKLKKKPKSWRLACQTTVGKQDSRGQVIIQQLPEWKGHEWRYGKPQEEDSDDL